MAASGIRIHRIRMTRRFERDYHKLPENIREEVKERLRLLLEDPRPARLRFEKLSGYRNPNIYTIHATNNHSHKISMEIADGIATLRRVGSHKKIDDKP